LVSSRKKKQGPNFQSRHQYKTRFNNIPKIFLSLGIFPVIVDFFIKKFFSTPVTIFTIPELHKSMIVQFCIFILWLVIVLYIGLIIYSIFCLYTIYKNKIHTKWVKTGFFASIITCTCFSLYFSIEIHEYNSNIYASVPPVLINKNNSHKKYFIYEERNTYFLVKPVTHTKKVKNYLDSLNFDIIKKSELSKYRIKYTK
jgi:hypothetical protein